jgi:hypothetical protein
MSTTTDRHGPQHHAAQRSAYVRGRRARELAQIREMAWEEGQIRVGALLIGCPDWLASIPIHVLLCWAPFVRHRVAHQMLLDAEIFGVKRLEQVTPSKRRLLAKRLGYDEGPFV